MGKIDSVISIPASLNDSFFRYWLEFLKPFHKLTAKETEVAACFLKHRYELSKVIQDSTVLNRVLLSEETKREIKEECGLTQSYFQFLLTKLKKAKIIDNGCINPKFIPRINPDSKSFQLLLYFDLQ